MNDYIEQHSATLERQKANREILQILIKAVESNPQMRFNQILVNINLTEPLSFGQGYMAKVETIEYYEESKTTLERISGNS